MTETESPPPSTNVRKQLRVAVYVFLVASAATTFFFSDRLWTAARLGELPIWAPLIAPGTFTLFVVVYALDRWMLVRQRASSLMRAFMQVAFAIIFVTLLWPQQAAQYRQTVRAKGDDDYAVRLLHHRDPDARAAACEIIGLRAQIGQSSTIERLARSDDVDFVRRACAQALDRLSAGAPPDPDPPRTPPP